MAGGGRERWAGGSRGDAGAAGQQEQGSDMSMEELLGHGVQLGASDVHVSAGLPPLMRVDGDIRPLEGPPLDQVQANALIREIMDEPQQRAFAAGQEVDFAFALPGLCRFRVNAFHHNRGVGAAFRTVPTQAPSLQGLGFGDVFRRISAAPRGLVLVTGATGSGKSTTLAAMIDCINETRPAHILTIEDPIEFVHASKRGLVHQREAHRHTKSFAAALRSALREDPDIIMVGEMRDQETISLALTAAETGHLVFGTLHTPSAAQTINRIVDVFPVGGKDLVRSMLSESLQAVIAQTLIKRRGGGRVAAHEILTGATAVRRLIREDKTAQLYSAMQAGKAQGMQTLDQHLKALVASGAVSVEVARAAARDGQAFGEP